VLQKRDFASRADGFGAGDAGLARSVAGHSRDLDEYRIRPSPARSARQADNQRGIVMTKSIFSFNRDADSSERSANPEAAGSLRRLRVAVKRGLVSIEYYAA